MSNAGNTKHDTALDVINITLYYFNDNKWMSSEPKPKTIRFKAIGKIMGSIRWRPHLIQHKDPLPLQDKKELNIMLDALRESISSQINLECVAITRDLLDDVSGEGVDDR